MKHLFFPILVIAILSISSCSLGDLLLSSGSISNSKKDTNLQLWESHATEVYKINQSLDQVVPFPDYEHDSFISLTVVKGEVEMVIAPNYVVFLESSIYTPSYITYSVEELFQLINDTRFNKVLNGPRVLEVNYDSVYGYPTYLHYDPSSKIEGDEFRVITKLVEFNADKPFSYDQRQAWKSLSKSDYNFEQDWGESFYSRFGLISVIDNNIESGISLPDSTEMTLPFARGNFATVLDLYYLIDQAYALKTYEIMNVHFDPEMNYPDSIYISSPIYSHPDIILDIVTKVVD